MEIQIGKNPEYTFNVYFSTSTHNGILALPFSLQWFRVTDAQGNKNFDLNIIILCFGFSLEIWRWKND